MRETNNYGSVQAGYSVCISHGRSNLPEAMDDLLSAKNADIVDNETGEVLATINNGEVTINANTLRMLLAEAYDEGMQARGY